MATSKINNNLKKRSFPLMVSPFTSQLGSAVYMMGLNWTLVKSTGNTQILGNIEAAGGLAFLAGDILVGSLVDHHDRKKVLIWTDLISFIFCLLASFIYQDSHPQIWLLTIVTLILNMMLAINYPASKSIAPEIIAEPSIQSFNAATNTLFNFANILAPMIGGLLLAFKNITFNDFLLINGLTFLIAAGLNSLIVYDFKQKETDSDPSSQQIAQQSVFKYLFQKSELVKLIISMGVLNLCASGMLLVSPYIASHFFGESSNNYSIFLAVSAVGGLIGGTSLYLQKKSVTAQQLWQQLIFFGMILFFNGLLVNYYLWIAIAFISGIFQARFFGSIPTLIQGNTD
ncbi:MFS transporter [Oenococcus alcoholitolerans]|uniref:MFS transporter n=1 Tax=Oenococcus alcoholitolerans TaxID=931074 RepID=UPI003F70E92B